ncbi:MAG: FMN-binding protein [Clostridiales bacterium]|nr:FMN-binding protein [Clostridiales bacterium]
MRKILALVLCVMMVLPISAMAEELTGQAKGFGGVVTVTVTREGNDITSVVVDAPNETPAIAKAAIDTIPAKIVETDSADVDVVAGATRTSNGIINAVKNALDPVNFPFEEEVKAEAAPAVVEASEAYIGLGVHNMGRLGPGADDQGVGVYSFNEVVAAVVFDAEGRILLAKVDQLEIATPNYDGATMPHLSGFPGATYNNDADHDAVVDGVIEVTEASFMAEVESWQSKRERGEGYVMGTGNWSQQMDTFEKVFVGKTVEEVEAWFAAYCSDRNGRPLKAGSTNEQDAAKYDALSDADKAMLADVTSSATMSLNDGHGNILGALKKAYENRVPLQIESAASIGLGIHNMGRLGPGADDQGVGVYSFNNVYAAVLFDAEGKVVASYVDQLEIATPNYDGSSMPHLSGFPGQKYNNDADHDAVVDSVIEVTEDSFMAEIETWLTKRERGEGYVMGTGIWSAQMDKFQTVFEGKTIEEINAWFAAYCSDRNGRPLKAGSTNEQDAAKYDALSDADKTMLADVVTSATMSLNDGHGNILGALEKAYENRVEIELTIGK